MRVHADPPWGLVPVFIANLTAENKGMTPNSFEADEIHTKVESDQVSYLITE